MKPDSDFHRFPHTPHLLWLGDHAPRGDKLLGPHEAARFFQWPVVVEEKVDGANLGFSVDPEGTLRAQNRGGYVDSSTHPQFGPLQRWMEPRRDALAEALGTDLILFGEWCIAVHSIEYTALPDWFLAFDVLERASGRFWSTERRDAMCRRLAIAQVPVLARRTLDRDTLLSLLGPSKLGAPRAEGVYVRLDEGEFLAARAKIVRAAFLQSIGDHWSARRMQRNHLATDAELGPGQRPA